MHILTVQRLAEIRTKDIACCPIPNGGLCNGGLMRLSDADGGWLVVPTNKSTPGRKLVAKYGSHLISVLLNKDFTLRGASPFECQRHNLPGYLHDLRISETYQLSGCFRKSLAHTFQPMFGRFNRDGVAELLPVLSPTLHEDQRLMHYDVKNWVHLSDYVLDCGPMPLWREGHAALIWEGEPGAKAAKIVTPLYGGHPARPSAPAFHWNDMCIASYHHHTINHRTGERVYWHQFAKLRDDRVDIEASTPPIRFSHGDAGIQFLTGAVVDGDDVVLSYGVNDEYNVIARARMQAITALLR